MKLILRSCADVVGSNWVKKCCQSRCTSQIDGPATAAASPPPAQVAAALYVGETSLLQQCADRFALVVAMLQQQPAVDVQMLWTPATIWRIADKPSPPGVKANAGSWRKAGRCGSVAAM